MTAGFTNDFQKKALDKAAHKPLWWFRYTDDISVFWHHRSEKLESLWTTWLLSTKASSSLWICTDVDMFMALRPKFTGDPIALWYIKFNKHPPHLLLPSLHIIPPPLQQAGHPLHLVTHRQGPTWPTMITDELKFLMAIARRNGYSQKQVYTAIHPPMKTNRPSKKATCHFPAVHPDILQPH